MKRIISAMFVFTISLSFSAISGSEETKFVNKAQDKLQTTFKNLQFTNFKESPIEGLFELNIGAQIIYFEPKNGYLIFGEIFNKKGVSLTAEEIKKQNALNTEEISTEFGIVIGDINAEKSIIEFTDPNCPYCVRYDKFITKEMPENVKRIVYFDTRLHPKAAIKAEHIICSENQEEAMKNIFSGYLPTAYKTCEEGKKILRHHAIASKKAGVRGTPSFLLDGEMLVGFRKKELLDFMSNKPEWLASSVATK